MIWEHYREMAQRLHGRINAVAAHVTRRCVAEGRFPFFRFCDLVRRSSAAVFCVLFTGAHPGAVLSFSLPSLVALSLFFLSDFDSERGRICASWPMVAGNIESTLLLKVKTEGVDKLYDCVGFCKQEN